LFVLLTITAAEKLSAKMKWSEYSDGGKPHYANRGKPKPDAIPAALVIGLPQR
jgi:hypothetical protein